MDEHSLRTIAAKLGVKVEGRNGKWLITKCPLAEFTHKNGTDNNPSFNLLVNDTGRSAYKCFSCKAKGRVSGLVRAIEHYTGDEYKGLALEADRKDMAVSLPDYDRENEEHYLPPEPLSEEYAGLYDSAMDYPEALYYLNARAITEGTIKKLSLGYDDTDRRIVVPVRGLDKKLYGYTGRTILPENQYPIRKSGRPYKKIKDYAGLPKKDMLLGADRVQEGKPCLVVEGIFGYLHLVEIGAEEICNPLALLGSDLHRGKCNMLLDIGEPVYLLPDNDAAGESCLWNEEGEEVRELKLLRSELPVMIPEWPEGKSDPDELTMENIVFLLQEGLTNKLGSVKYE